MNDTGTGTHTAVKVILIIVGIVLLLPGLCGMFFFGAGTATWISNGFSFQAAGGYNFESVMVAIGGASIIGSVLLLTILIYASGWKTGQKLCLWLALLSGATVAIGYASLIGEFPDTLGQDWMMLQLSALGGLVLGFLPPFLVWRKYVRSQADGQA